eukprot:4856354-Prymnesium_polylepis.2
MRHQTQMTWWTRGESRIEDADMSVACASRWELCRPTRRVGAEGPSSLRRKVPRPTFPPMADGRWPMADVVAKG